MITETEWNDRHPSVAHFAPLFVYAVVQESFDRSKLSTGQRDAVQRSVALRKLLETKDAAVRQAVMDRKKAEQPES